jgi:hypothetical protein
MGLQEPRAFLGVMAQQAQQELLVVKVALELQAFLVDKVLLEPLGFKGMLEPLVSKEM